MEKKTRFVKVMYRVMFFLMDVESIMWWIAEKIIYPVALLRREVAEIINERVKK